MGYPIKPRQELAFWATLRQMAEKASYQAPAVDGAYNAYRLVTEHAAQKQEYWQSISGIAPEPSVSIREHLESLELVVIPLAAARLGGSH